jgi:histidyl-tRNA synthetase
MKFNFQSPKGVLDVLPSDQKYWDHIVNIVNKRALSFGFEKIILPIFEDAGLYQKGTGINTDIVQKEMYEVKPFNTQDSISIKDKRYALRPEFTPGAIRAYLEHGMISKPQPVKLLSIGPVFRHDKPQKGRYRQFWQFNVEAIGSKNPLIDALLILMIHQIFTDLGLKDTIVLEINNIGCSKCQGKIRKKIIEFIEPIQSKLCPVCQNRIYSNPLRIIDCKEKKCQKIVSTLPHIIDFICNDCKRHFTKVLEYLDDLKVTYDLNPYLVRGIDYYTSTTFEIKDKNDPTKQNSLGGGGHYDNLIKNYSNQNIPGLGFAGGIERIVEKLKTEEIKIPSKSQTDIFIVQIGKKAQKKSMSLIAELASKNYQVGCAIGKDTLSSQLKIANKVKTKFAIIIGQREILDNTIIIKNMQEATQETIDQSDLEAYLNKKLNESK